VAAAEHTRNRGLKLVLKSYAQERAAFAVQLRAAAGLSAAEAGATGAGGGGALGRGWASMRAWFTVRRQSRQRLLLQKAREAEQAAIAVYARVLGAEKAAGTGLEKSLPSAPELPPTVLEAAQAQLAALKGAARRLDALSAPRRESTLLVRLYERPEQLQQAVTALEGAGVPRDEVYVADVARLQPYADDTGGRERARWETMLAAAVVGAVLGSLIILPFALAQRIYFPQLGGLLTGTADGAVLEYLVGGALVGAIFGLYFSIFIGQDIVEDDAYLYEQSLENGRVLLAVGATAANRAAVERALGLQHQFEVQPA
jgi:hypothetical protein